MCVRAYELYRTGQTHGPEREMTACRLAATSSTSRYRPAGGEGGGLQSQAVFMGHISETGGEEPGREDLKRPNECESVRARTSLSAVILPVAERGGGSSIKSRKRQRG